MLGKAKIEAFAHSQFARCTVIAIAAVCLISPDPFSDIFAFWLLAKIGCNPKSLFRKMSALL